MSHYANPDFLATSQRPLLTFEYHVIYHYSSTRDQNISDGAPCFFHLPKCLLMLLHKYFWHYFLLVGRVRSMEDYFC